MPCNTQGKASITWASTRAAAPLPPLPLVHLLAPASTHSPVCLPSRSLLLQAGELASQLHCACEKQYLAAMGLLVHATRHCNLLVRSYWQ